MRRIYLDHAATTPLAPAALHAMLPWLRDTAGNPLSLHAEGRRARTAVDAARDRLAAVLGCAPREIISRGRYRGGQPGPPRSLDAGEGSADATSWQPSSTRPCSTPRDASPPRLIELTVVGCDQRARRPRALAAAVRADTVLVSLMLVNNETGTMQDVATARGCGAPAQRDPLVHTDAVQAFGRVPVHPGHLDVDLLSFGAQGLRAQGRRRPLGSARRVPGHADHRRRPGAQPAQRPGTSPASLVSRRPWS